MPFWAQMQKYLDKRNKKKEANVYKSQKQYSVVYPDIKKFVRYDRNETSIGRIECFKIGIRRYVRQLSKNAGNAATDLVAHDC